MEKKKETAHATDEFVSEENTKFDELASKQIKKWAKEGMRISEIWRKHYPAPKYTYKDIYEEVYGQDARSSLGTMRVITNRLDKLEEDASQEQMEWIGIIRDGIGYIYENYMKSQKKLDTVRDVIERGD